MHTSDTKTTEASEGFGFIVNLKKSELKPSQRFDFLGYLFLLDLALVFILFLFIWGFMSLSTLYR